MLIFDQLKKDDPQLRAVTAVVLGGLCVLLAGLWWIQVVSARDYQDSLQTQSYRTVRVPAVRGKILDRNGIALAENRPTYNLSLYLEDMRDAFAKEYSRLRPVRVVTNGGPFWKRWLGGSGVQTQFVRLSKPGVQDLTWRSRYAAASNLVSQVTQRLGQTIVLDPVSFRKHFETQLALPYPVLSNLVPVQIARFEENSFNSPGLDLEIQSTRVYPFQTTACHVLGYLQFDDSSVEGEEAFFSYRLPDFRGVLGIEGGYDKQLRGSAGAKSVLVNNVGYRQTENVWSTAAPGHSVVLTIDLRVQQAAERALQEVKGPITRGAVVVMDVNSGDILAMASSPTVNPNHSVLGFPKGEWERRQDTELRPVINRATQENYQPGSIFKTVVAMACLEDGLDQSEEIYNPGYYKLGRGKPMHDTAPPGSYNFRRAIKLSSNTYFITQGLRVGAAKIVRVGQRLHLGERTGLATRQEVSGNFPSLQKVSGKWSEGDTANLCIGQGEIDVTPLQMAVLTSAIANGGKVWWPRLVARVQTQDPFSTEPPIEYPAARVRDNLGVQPRTLSILREAMLADVEDKDGGGREAGIEGMRIAGKTGTAQKEDAHGVLEEYITWFVSFAPYDSPHYAVVVMVEKGGSGGKTCAPVARKIYLALQQLEGGAAKGQSLVKAN
jgi:penicillin-binding protein 2